LLIKITAVDAGGLPLTALRFGTEKVSGEFSAVCGHRLIGEGELHHANYLVGGDPDDDPDDVLVSVTGAPARARGLPAPERGRRRRRDHADGPRRALERIFRLPARVAPERWAEQVLSVRDCLGRPGVEGNL
jgi:hypothetical protein